MDDQCLNYAPINYYIFLTVDTEKNDNPNYEANYIPYLFSIFLIAFKSDFIATNTPGNFLPLAFVTLSYHSLAVS